MFNKTTDSTITKNIFYNQCCYQFYVFALVSSKKRFECDFAKKSPVKIGSAKNVHSFYNNQFLLFEELTTNKP